VSTGTAFNLPGGAVTHVTPALLYRSRKPVTTKGQQMHSIHHSATLMRRRLPGPAHFFAAQLIAALAINAALPSPRVPGCDAVKLIRALERVQATHPNGYLAAVVTADGRR
jgi:hypothetical protein